jgi:hypothetical protein
MQSKRIRPGTAWIVCYAFFTSLTACGGGREEAPPPTTLVVPTTVVPTTAPAPTLPSEAPEQLSQAQIQELVAPVALYPDVILASLLPATTYPEQVTDAAGWMRQQPQPIQGIPDDRNWDGSVAGLLQFPDVLNWLDQNDPWEEQMGSAMTYQQGDVLQGIQDYRKLALDAGNLKSNEQMQVTTDADQDIRISPAQPDTVYVPQYDTAAMTQPQAETGVNPWLAAAGGVAVGALGAWALYSIFDDDDDDDHHHGGGGGGKKTVTQYNNYYYGGSGQRPGGGGSWNPQTRPARRRHPGQIARPQPVQPIYAAKPSTRPAAGGLQPPKKRAGKGGGKVAQPTPAPVAGAATPAMQDVKKGGGKKHAGGDQQAGGKQKQKNAAPAPAQPSVKSKPQKQQKQGGGQQKQNKNKKKKQQGGSAK